MVMSFGTLSKSVALMMASRMESLSSYPRNLHSKTWEPFAKYQRSKTRVSWLCW